MLIICSPSIFTARHHASAVYAINMCPYVRLSVRSSQVEVLRRRLDLGSHKQRHTIAQEL